MIGALAVGLSQSDRLLEDIPTQGDDEFPFLELEEIQRIIRHLGLIDDAKRVGEVQAHGKLWNGEPKPCPEAEVNVAQFGSP